MSICPPWMWNVLVSKIHYIYQSHTTHSLSYTFKFLSSLLRKSDFLFSQTRNPKPSTSLMATSTSGSGMQLGTGSSYLIKPKTMSIPLESFEVQIESPVDFASLKRNGMDMEALISMDQHVHWEVSYCVFEQLIIWYYILVKLSLEVQGGQDYFRIVEGTCIIACVLLSFLHSYSLSAAFRLWTQIRLWTLSDFDPRNSIHFVRIYWILYSHYVHPYYFFILINNIF